MIRLLSSPFFSCIDSRTLNKHMFNKHGRQTPIKSGANLLGRGGGRGLPTMLPMLGGRPYGGEAAFNPALWARKPTPGNSALDQARIENELRNRFPALPPTLQNLEQIQLLQDQANLMANITKNNEMLNQAAAERQAQFGMPGQEMGGLPGMIPGNSLMQNSNSVLIAQIAAQMQRACQQQANNPENALPTRFNQTTVEEAKDIVNIKSEENSRSNSPKNTDSAVEGQISVLSDGEASNEGEEKSNSAIPASPKKEADEQIEKESVKSATGEDNGIGEMQNELSDLDKTSSMENTREEEAKCATSPLQIAQENDEAGNISTHADIVVEPTSPVGSFGAASVKSEKPDSAEEINPRKRKMEEPLDYSFNEQLFQQRLQQNRQLFPFPIPNFPVSFST